MSHKSKVILGVALVLIAGVIIYKKQQAKKAITG